VSDGNGGGGGGGQPLKTATAVVGLLAGIVALLYVLGGLVIALRLFFDSFSFNSVVPILGQLPREVVISTAMLDVLLLAATFGLLFGLLVALVVGLRGNPFEWRPKWKERLQRDEAEGVPGDLGWRTFFVALAVSAALMAPAIIHARQTSGPTLTLVSEVIGLLATCAAACAGWYLLRLVVAGGLKPGFKLSVVAGIAATVAVIPAVMFAASLSFENAQACVTGTSVPVKGKLIGEGGGQVLFEQHFGREAGVVSVPTSQVTRTEYGDISSNFSCPAPPETGKKIAEVALEGHGSTIERALAMELRPRLRFDSAERWRPVSVASFLAESYPHGGAQLACWRGLDPHCNPAGGIGRLRRGGDAPEFIDIEGERKNGADAYSPDPLCTSPPTVFDCNDGKMSAVYYRRTTHEGRWYWDYWWFLRYNDYNGQFNDCTFYCGDHEGDWEGITVITTPELNPQILGAVYAAHKDRVLIEGDILPRSGSHPVVFVAAGTHASYPFRCNDGNCHQFGTLGGVHLPEESHDGDVAWGGNVDAHCSANLCVRPLPEIGAPPDLATPLAGGWAGWPGKWGKTCIAGCSRAESSPNSPGLQIRFRCPWAPTRWALLAPDGTVSRSEPAGDAERLRAVCESQRGD